MVRYNFPQSDAESWMAGFDRAIAKINHHDRDDHVGRAATMDDAVICVLAVSLLARNEGTQPWVRKRLPAFQAHVRQLLRENRSALAAWLGTIDVALWQRNRDGWYQASMGRSAVEVLANEVDDASEDPLVPSHLIDELDEEMSQIGPTLNALPQDVIPRGIPESHWWWLLPEGPAEDDTDEADFSY